MISDITHQVTGSIDRRKSKLFQRERIQMRSPLALLVVSLKRFLHPLVRTESAESGTALTKSIRRSIPSAVPEFVNSVNYVTP